MSPQRRIAVVGGGIGGLTAAGYLGRAGHAVTLFEAADAVGGKAGTLAGPHATFDTGPTLLTLPAIPRQAFDDVGAADLLPRIDVVKTHCEYRWPDGRRFTASGDLEAMSASAGEIRPRERDNLVDFYGAAEEVWRAAGEPYLEAPYEGAVDFMRRVLRRGLGAVTLGMRLGTLDAFARRYLSTHHLQQFAGRFATYTGASPYLASASFAMVAHVERAFGLHHVQGGMGALVRSLERAVARQGVRIRVKSRAAWRRAGEEFVVGPAGEEEPFDAMVVNADPLALTGRPDGPRAMSGYVLFVEVDRRLHLPHHEVLFSGDYRREFDQIFAGQLPDDPTVYLCHPVRSDPTMAAAGHSGVYVMVNAPARKEGEDLSAAARAMWERVMRRVESVHPEMSGRWRVVGERTPADLEALGAPGGSIYGFLPHGRFGPFRRPRMRSATPGLFFAGGGTHPGGGVPLVMLSGRFAAGLVENWLGAKAPRLATAAPSEAATGRRAA